MKSAVFFDIDGTLLEGYKYIPPSVYEGVKLLREKGNYAFICTGRAMGFVHDPKLLAVGFDGFVAGCGCHVQLGDSMLYEQLIPNDQMEWTVETVREYGFKPILEGPEHLYLDESEFPKDDAYGSKLWANTANTIAGINSNWGNWKANKFSCDMHVSDEMREACYEKLRRYYDIIPHTSTVAEMVPKGNSKATGMAKMIEHLGIDQAHTYAFGDSVNDLTMLKFAGTGICMGNGVDAAKEAADYVTAELLDDGIYKGLEHFGLI